MFIENVTGTLAGVIVTLILAVTGVAVDCVVDVADALAVSVKVVEVSDAGTVTSTVAPVASDASLAIVTVASELVHAQPDVVTVELSLAVTTP